jgi:hypothetical protein
MKRNAASGIFTKPSGIAFDLQSIAADLLMKIAPLQTDCFGRFGDIAVKLPKFTDDILPLEILLGGPEGIVGEF